MTIMRLRTALAVLRGRPVMYRVKVVGGQVETARDDRPINVCECVVTGCHVKGSPSRPGLLVREGHPDQIG